MSHAIATAVPRPQAVNRLPTWGRPFDRVRLPGCRYTPKFLRDWALRRLAASGRLALADADLVDALGLIASELAANATQHSASGLPGGALLGELYLPPDRVALRVLDSGPCTDRPAQPLAPPLRLDALALVDAEHGRGLALVALCASRYGWTRPPGDPTHSVWAELATGPDRAQGAGVA